MSSVNLNWTWHSFDELSNEQLYQVLRLRQRVFVVEQQCCYEDLDLWDQKAVHLLAHAVATDNAENAPELLAYCRVFAPGVRFAQASIGRVLSATEARHLRLGHQLLERSVEYCDQHFPESAIQIDAQAHLTRFYQTYGFRVVGDEHLVDDIPHVTMFRDASQNPGSSS